MNAIEAQLLQNSIQNFGASGERRAQRTEQARQFDLTRQDHLGQMGLENEMKKMQLGATAETAQGKAKERANRFWNDTVKMHGEWVKDGMMEPDAALKSLQGALSKVPPESQSVLADNPNFQAVQSGELVWKTPKGKEGSVAIKTGLEFAKQLRADAAKNPAEAEQNTKYADMIEAWATKQGQFAPQKQAVGYEETSKEFTNPDTDIKTTQRKRTPIPLSPFPVSSPTNPATNAAPKQAASGVTATNPKTGEKIQFINGKWQPIR